MAMTIDIASHKVGSGHPCFIIAEAGVNHNGSLDMARKLVDVAVEAGADTVKFQTFKADSLVSAVAPKAEYQIRTTGATESQHEMISRLELTPEMHEDLIEYCHERGILFMSSPFDESSADLLDGLGVPVFKIPSGEITNLPFLKHVACKGKPMIVSTGMADLAEVETAMNTIREAGNEQVVLLQCVSNYPADPANVNLRAMATMEEKFSVPVGYSDHTPGTEIAIAAVALGATVIEKHFTLDRTLPGPDHEASLEPDELDAMVRGIRNAQAALGTGEKIPSPSEKNTADVARKSLVAAFDISAGTVLTEENIAIMRPGTGLPPVMKSQIIGKTIRTALPAGSLLTMEMVD